MKEIKLVCDAPFFDKVDVNVLDFPSGPEGEPRRRCKITVEFGPYDLAQLKKQGLDYDGAMEYYEKKVYDTVKFYLAHDWVCIDGHDELFDIIEERFPRIMRSETQKRTTKWVIKAEMPG